MSISGVTNSNKVDLVKLALQQKASKVATSQKPDYMTMTGSIFNAPNAKSSSSTSTLNELNTSKSIEDLNQTSSSSTNSNSIEDIKNIDNVADGKAAAAEAEKSADQVKSLTSETEADAETVNNFSSNAKKLDKQIAKDEKSFTQKLKQQQKEIEKDNKTLEKLVKESEETQTEIENAQNELDSLMATNSFSINGDGTQSNSNQDRINELQKFLGTKINLLQANGQQIYSLQRSSSRTIKQMERTNNQFVKIQQTNTKQIEANQSTTDKIIKVADKIEQVSALVSQTGQAVNYAGLTLVALGSSMSFLAGAGSALIATGKVMQKVGKVTEMVGNYGQSAANITKTAAYAADGNLAGALTSAAAAVQTGYSAGKATKELDKTFSQINEQANKATQKLAANTAAREAVNNASKEELNGMTKKEARKAISSNLQEQMANGTISTDANWSNAQLKDLTSQMTAKGEDGTSIASRALNASAETFGETVEGAGGKIENGVVSGLNKKATKSVQSKFSNTVTNTIKTSKSFDWAKVAKSLQSTAALFASQSNQNVTNNNTQGYAPQWDLSQNRIFQKSRNYRLARMSMA